MIDRRQFLSRGATVSGFAACGPVFGVGSASADGARTSHFRWIGGQLREVSPRAEQIGDYLVRKSVDNLTGGQSVHLDVFVSEPAPSGGERETILRPLGRHEDVNAAFDSIRTHTRGPRWVSSGTRSARTSIEEAARRRWPADL
jgi:hypothetical protein